MTTVPELMVADFPLRVMLSGFAKPGTLFVTDPHNAATVRAFGPTVVVVDPYAPLIEKIIQTHTFTQVVAVGGCTALDVGRACAIYCKKLVVMPTVLSTAAFSSNRSIINHNGVYKSEQTLAPEDVYISLPALTATPAAELQKWTTAGLADLFSHLTAAIEFEYARHNNNLRQVHPRLVAAHIPHVVELVTWVNTQFIRFDKPALQRVAEALHLAGADVVRNGHTRLSEASAQKLALALRQQYRYPKNTVPHGMLVGFGTLLMARIFAEEAGYDGFYTNLRMAMGNLGLPLSYEALAKSGVYKTHIMNAIVAQRGTPSLLRDYFLTHNFDILDRVFTAITPAQSMARTA